MPPDAARDEQGRPEQVPFLPDLFWREAATALVLTAGVTLVSALVRAPLGPAANPGLSLNPAKAPWYFLGFQELLVHLHPLFAVVVVPLLGAAALCALPWLGFSPDEPRGVWFLSATGRRTARWAAVAGAGVDAAPRPSRQPPRRCVGEPRGRRRLLLPRPVAGRRARGPLRCGLPCPPRAPRRDEARGRAGALRLPRGRLRRPHDDRDLVARAGDGPGVAVDRVRPDGDAAAGPALVAALRVARPRRRRARRGGLDRRFFPPPAPAGAGDRGRPCRRRPDRHFRLRFSDRLPRGEVLPGAARRRRLPRAPPAVHAPRLQRPVGRGERALRLPLSRLALRPARRRAGAAGAAPARPLRGAHRERHREGRRVAADPPRELRPVAGHPGLSA